MPSGGKPAGICADCGASLCSQQRYCLGCGERLGPRSPQLDVLVCRARERGEPAPPPAHAPAASVPGEGGKRLRAGPSAAVSSGAGAGAGAAGTVASLLAGLSELKLPSPRISALLVLAFAGFGVLLGSAASSRVDDTLAASARPRLKLMLPATSSGAPTSESSRSASEPPPASAEETPPSSATPETASKPSPAAAPAPSSQGSGSGAGESGGGKGDSAPPPGGTGSKLPAIKHVFVIMLSDQPYAAVFGPSSTAPYLSHALEARGALLPRYYAVAHEQLANAIALVSGQGPTRATAANCPLYTDITPATIGAEQQVAGEGCIYPPTTATLPGQLEVKHLSWRAYVQGIDEAGNAGTACAHPALGAQDPSSSPASTQQYATFRNPFVYFQGLTESPSCVADVVGLSKLNADLASARRTPSLAYIVPDRCHDGSPGPCPGGGPGGLPAADGLLRALVPKILASAAYKRGGLLLITVDEAPSSGLYADSSSCCGQPRFSNLPPASGVAASLPPEGGGQVGALLLSPFVKRHTTSQEPYNHFSMLRTIEDLFSLKHIGYAAAASSLAPELFATKPSASG